MSESIGRNPASDSGAFNPAMILDYTKRVITDPAGFFQQMPRKGGFGAPLIYVIVIAVITAAVQAILGMIGFGPAGMFAAGIAGLVLLPILAAIGSFIGAAILFVIWKLMGSEEDYETAYRCAAYAYGYAPVAALVSGIPYIGTLVQILWPTVLIVLATIHVHGRKPALAWGVFGILGILAAVSMLGTEIAARRFMSELESASQQMKHEYGGKDGEFTPEDAGRAVKDLLENLKKMEQEGQ